VTAKGNRHESSPKKEEHSASFSPTTRKERKGEREKTEGKKKRPVFKFFKFPPL
jgi:hypothetical protein